MNRLQKKVYGDNIHPSHFRDKRYYVRIYVAIMTCTVGHRVWIVKISVIKQGNVLPLLELPE